MTPDPTTRDPAASLRACIELAAKATPGPWTTGDGDLWAILSVENWHCVAEANVNVPRSSENALTIAAAVNWVRDDAPALLAEVERLRAEVATLDQCLANAMATVHEQDNEAEAAERALTAAVEMATRIAHFTDREMRDGDAARDLCDTFLAHHGARTGETK